MYRICQLDQRSKIDLDNEWIQIEAWWDTFEGAWSRLLELEAQWPKLAFSIRC